MKVKYSNYFLAVTVLFVMLAQAIDGTEHLITNIHTKKCVHKHYSNDYFTHQHQGHNQCFVCDFSFSTFTFLHNEVAPSNIAIDYYSRKNIFFLNNQLYFYFGTNRQLRGPPQFIV